MSQAVGTIDPGYNVGTKHYGVPNLSVNGPWLNNRQTNKRDDPWFTYGKTTRSPDSRAGHALGAVGRGAKGLNDAAFAFGMETPQWIDAPGSYHNRGCGFAFADGHSETHQWKGPTPKIQRPRPHRSGRHSRLEMDATTNLRKMKMKEPS